ncbi:MAG: arginine repressor [Bacteroidetes bacterium]|nr:arginine repressor [Bacteroidota bacterium]MBU2584054.1 arginine repressor [Bacteroidota bacterium]
MSKKIQEIQNRHAVIKSLISTQEIYNQTQLVKVLKQKGINVTQATLSRDLTELGVVRVPTSSGLVYKIVAAGNESILKSHIAEEVISIDGNECLVVIKTFPGRAQGVALFLDKQNEPEFLGTVAGDDTIIVIPRTVKRAKKIIEKIKTILGIK